MVRILGSANGDVAPTSASFEAPMIQKQKPVNELTG
jgi:hypothetical protein